MTTEELAERHPALWASATRHPFLDAARDGSLTEREFARWLEQDHHFVVGLTRAWGRLLGAAPPGDFALLCDGIAAFTAELSWFEQLAEERSLRLEADVEPAAAAYVAYLGEVASSAYPVAITAMWAVEAAYLEAWRGALGGSRLYSDLVEHWTGAEFAAFVARLAEVADRELRGAPEHQATAEGAFVRVLEHEAVFWGLGGVGAPA